MGTSRNGRCEATSAPEASKASTRLQWGPPGMGGVSPVALGALDETAATSMGTSRNGRCETSCSAMSMICASLLQWGPPGMGGVRIGIDPERWQLGIVLQWGPPGMGGVRRSTHVKASLRSRDFNGDLPEWEV